MKETSPGGYTLVIADNGPGFPPDVDFRNTSSLGLQLVNNLVIQLDGDISLDCSNGAAFTMHLKPIEDYGKKGH